MATTANNCDKSHKTPLLQQSPSGNTSDVNSISGRLRNSSTLRNGSIRMLRLAQVKDVTGLGKTKIYELQEEGAFPMRVKITARSVAWIEDEVQAWLAARIQASTPLQTT